MGRGWRRVPGIRRHCSPLGSFISPDNRVKWNHGRRASTWGEGGDGGGEGWWQGGKGKGVVPMSMTVVNAEAGCMSDDMFAFWMQHP